MTLTNLTHYQGTVRKGPGRENLEKGKVKREKSTNLERNNITRMNVNLVRSLGGAKAMFKRFM